jgi:hypothetical protein
VSKLTDTLSDPRVVGAVITALLGIAGVSGLKVADATSDRDSAIERAAQQVREDIDHGYQMCRADTERRVERGEERVVPNTPNKKIERAANAAIQEALVK